LKRKTKLWIALAILLSLATLPYLADAREFQPFIILQAPQTVDSGQPFNLTVQVRENSIDLNSLAVKITATPPGQVKYTGYTDGDNVLLEIPTTSTNFPPWTHQHSFKPNFTQGRFATLHLQATGCGPINFQLADATAYTMDMTKLNTPDFTTWNTATNIKCKIRGDMDGDSDVDNYDYRLFIKAYGSHRGDPDFNPDADLDSDGDVDIQDYARFATAYTSYTGPTITPTPRPTATPIATTPPIPGPTPPMPPTPNPNAGDLNNDGAIDHTDLHLMVESWKTGARTGDLNGDGTIDMRDVEILDRHWHQ